MSPLLILLQLTAHQFAAVTLLMAPPLPSGTVTLSKPIDSTLSIAGIGVTLSKVEPGLYSMVVHGAEVVGASTIRVDPGSNAMYRIHMTPRDTNATLVTGRLMELTSKEPAGGFVVQLPDGRRTTTADDGSFAFVNVPRGFVRFGVLLADSTYADRTEHISSVTDSVRLYLHAPHNNSITNGLVAYYPFDGADMSDVGINSTHGTNFGAVAVADHNNNPAGALGFNRESRAQIPDAGWQHQLPMSISFWLRVDRETPDQTLILSKYVNPSNKGWSVYLYGSNFAFSYAQESTSSWRGVNNRMVARDGRWHHCVATVDVNMIALYVDGSRTLSTLTPQQLQPTSCTEPIYIGRAASTSADKAPFFPGFAGALDELRFYNRVLTDEEIKLLGEE